MFRYNDPTVEYILDHWPMTILVPFILLVITVLALVTRWWDKRDLEMAPPRAHDTAAAPPTG